MGVSVLPNSRSARDNIRRAAKVFAHPDRSDLPLVQADKEASVRIIPRESDDASEARRDAV